MKLVFTFFFNVRDARVMWDQKTGRSRGFGFVSFRNQQVLRGFNKYSVCSMLCICYFLLE